MCSGQAQTLPPGQHAGSPVSPIGTTLYQPHAVLYGPFSVVRIVNGHQFVIENNGMQEVVALIGITTPNTPEAGLFLGRLISGKSLFLELDEFERDFDGTILAYAYVYNPLGEWVWQGQRWSQINYTLLASGLATTAPHLNQAYMTLYNALPSNRRYAQASGAVASPDPPQGKFVDLERKRINTSLLHRFLPFP